MVKVTDLDLLDIISGPKKYLEMTRVESTLQLLTHLYNNLHHLHNPKILN